MNCCHYADCIRSKNAWYPASRYCFAAATGSRDFSMPRPTMIMSVLCVKMASCGLWYCWPRLSPDCARFTPSPDQSQPKHQQLWKITIITFCCHYTAVLQKHKKPNAVYDILWSMCSQTMEHLWPHSKWNKPLEWKPFQSSEVHHISQSPMGTNLSKNVQDIYHLHCYVIYCSLEQKLQHAQKSRWIVHHVCVKCNWNMTLKLVWLKLVITFQLVFITVTKYIFQ